MQGHVRKRHRPTCAKKQDNNKRCNCDGPWQGRFRDPLDKSKWHEKSYPTKREAENWLQNHQGNLLRNEWVDPRKTERPFSEVVAEWKKSWDARLSPTTTRRYDSILDKYLVPEFGTAPVGRIDHGAVQRYIDELANAKGDDAPAPGTVRNVYAVLRTAMARAVRLGWIKANPCTDVDLPRARREEMLFLTADEVRAVAEKIDPQYRVLVYVAAYTGLRAGELAGLQRQDVDLLRGVVHVRRALKDVNGRLELGPVKTDHSRRTVTLPKSIRDLLDEHLRASTGGPDSYVFTMKGGGPLRHGLLYNRYFRRAVAGWTDKRGKEHKGALPPEKHGLRWHDLRHTAASLSINSGAHPLLVSKMLGHSSVQITLDRYSHLFPDVAEALAVKLDAAFVAAQAPAMSASNVAQLR